MENEHTGCNAYSGFAQVYDTFMDDIPYDSWVEYIQDLLGDYGIHKGIVLDLGCGTGNLTTRLARSGFDMIGVDNSIEMLNIANEKRVQEGLGILYLHQDMRKFELFGTVAAVVSGCDSINYLHSEKDLLDTFRGVANYLDDQGVFLFDLKTIHFFEELGSQVFADNREECSFIWDNYFDEEAQMNEYELTIFVRGQDNRYDRYDEFHYQKGFSIETVRLALGQAGLDCEAVYRAFSRQPGNEGCERLYFVARKDHI